MTSSEAENQPVCQMGDPTDVCGAGRRQSWQECQSQPDHIWGGPGGCRKSEVGGDSQGTEVKSQGASVAWRGEPGPQGLRAVALGCLFANSPASLESLPIAKPCFL